MENLESTPADSTATLTDSKICPALLTVGFNSVIVGIFQRSFLTKLLVRFSRGV